MFKFHKKLKHFKKEVLEWRKKENTNSRIQIEGIKRQMEKMQEEGGQSGWDTLYNLRS